MVIIFCGSPGVFPGMSGGPVLEKFSNGAGRLLGISFSFFEALNVLNDAQTNPLYVLITPTFQFCFGKFNFFKFDHCIVLIFFLILGLFKQKQKTKSYEVCFFKFNLVIS